MIVRNTVSWAGDDFSFMPGDLIEIHDFVGEARIAAGLAEFPEDVEQPEGPCTVGPRLWSPPAVEGQPQGEAPRRRGRPRKVQPVDTDTTSTTDADSNDGQGDDGGE